MNDIAKLLNDVSIRVKNIDEHQRKHGELFNIFSIAKVDRLEVNTHSAMIAELLNPSGSHGQGDKFLTLFLNILMPDELFEGTKNAHISKETSFNKKKDRVDIVIDFDKHIFFIENKIDALDGNKQLKRYADILTVLEKKGKIGHLIYLTKYGFVAEEYSHHGVNYQCISYKEHIFDWLNLCIKEMDYMPVIKHALLQYQYLIKKITGTTMTHELKNELVALLLEGNNLKTAQTISGIILLAKGKILFNFFERLEQTMPTVSVVKGSFPELEYDKEKCIAWFKKGKRKSHSIGIFFDIGLPDILFRVEVATATLHYGVIPVKRADNGKYECVDIHNVQNSMPRYFELRNWKRIKWFSKVYIDDVFQDVELNCIRDEKNLIEELVNAIEKLRQIAGGYELCHDEA